MQSKCHYIKNFAFLFNFKSECANKVTNIKYTLKIIFIKTLFFANVIIKKIKNKMFTNKKL